MKKKRPQYKAICEKVTTVKPKKPNSAQRSIIKVLFKNNKSYWAYIPGEKHNIKINNTVLVRPGKVQDLPGVNYKVIRGTLDCTGVESRKTSRSKYGKKK